MRDRSRQEKSGANWACIALREISDPAARKEIADMKDDPDPQVRRHAETCDRIWDA